MKTKTLILAVSLIVVSLTTFAQNTIGYQSVVRKTDNTLAANMAVNVSVQILQGTLTGTGVYTENFTSTQTNANGLLSLQIGNAAGFATINWANGPYFIKTNITGSNINIEASSQLLSVPYALHAKTVETITETDPVFNTSAAKAITNTNISNWNTAYSWGNHATQGYLASFTETDPVFAASPAKNITNGNITTWNSLKNVNITAGNGITVSGTYPNITITNNAPATQNTDTLYIGKPWYENNVIVGYIIYLDHTKQHGIVLHKNVIPSKKYSLILDAINNSYTGWSIPTIEQMNEIYKNMYMFNKIESGISNKIDVNSTYWTSSSYTGIQYYKLSNLDPYAGTAASRMVKEF